MSDVNLSISQEVVKPIIEAKIQAAIANELQTQSQVIDRIVNRVLVAKVDSDGKESCYARDITYVQWLCHDCIRQAALSAVKESVETMKPKIKNQIVKELEKQKGQIAEALTQFFSENAVNHYRMNVTVAIQPK